MIVKRKISYSVCTCYTAQYQSMRYFHPLLTIPAGDRTLPSVLKPIIKRVYKALKGCLSTPASGGGSGNVTHNHIYFNCCNPGATLSFHTYHDTAHQASNSAEARLPSYPESFHSAQESFEANSPLEQFNYPFIFCIIIICISVIAIICLFWRIKNKKRKNEKCEETTPPSSYARSYRGPLRGEEIVWR